MWRCCWSCRCCTAAGARPGRRRRRGAAGRVRPGGLGVHFVSDVLAGWLIGLGWLAVTVAAFESWRRASGRPHDADRGRHRGRRPGGYADRGQTVDLAERHDAGVIPAAAPDDDPLEQDAADHRTRRPRRRALVPAARTSGATPRPTCAPTPPATGSSPLVDGADVLPAAVRRARTARRPATRCTSWTSAATWTSACTVPAARSGGCWRERCRARRRRVRAAVALAPAVAQAERGGQRRAGPAHRRPRRPGDAGRAHPPGREPPPEAGRHPPPRPPRRTTSRSSAASTSGSAAATTTTTAATRRRWTSRRRTARGPPGTTSRPRSAGRPCTTSSTRSASAGTAAACSTSRARCGSCTTAPTTRSAMTGLPLPEPQPDDATPHGTHAVQVLRTYPARLRRYPFAPHGERSIAQAYRRAFARARRLVYLEDQYLWSRDVADVIAGALRREPGAARRRRGAAATPTARGGSRETPAQRRRARTRCAGAPRPAATASRCTTWRTRRGRRSTCTPRSSSSTTCGR